MRNYALFKFDYLFSDHFALVSDQAKLLYIKMNFYADNGFVPNPKAITDSLGYDKGVMEELIANGDLLKLDDRCEVFITSYYIHNKGISYKSWFSSPFSVYWRGKLWIKPNGIATLKPMETNNEQVVEQEQEEIKMPSDPKLQKEIKKSLDSLSHKNDKKDSETDDDLPFYV